jgi:hypothetical protein
MEKQNCTDEEIGKLCDYAMCGDKGISESYNAKLEIGKTIAHGNNYCEIRFIKKEK